jgi:arylsulfatase
MTAEVGLKYYDAWGSDRTYPHMAIGWTWAFDTPFSWTKQIASHFGGVRQGMAISWPRVISDKGGIRNQFHHVIDVVPTILEATRIKQPQIVDGIRQKPIEGVSMAYTFDAKNANAASRHKTQYFEMMADRAIYHDGWIASTKVMRPPWVTFGPAAQDPAAFPWELYDVRKDWTQSKDLAASNPAKLKEMQDLFWTEAAKYQVLPLDATVATRLVTPRPSITAGRNVFTWTRPLTGTPNGDAPSILNASYAFKAEIDVPKAGAEGVLITQGGRFGGYGFYLLKGRPVFTWNLVDLQRVKWESPDPLPPGKHVLEFDFKYDGLGIATLAFNNLSGIGRSGTGVLKVDGKAVATQKMERTIPLILQWDENLDVGSDTGTPVDDKDYQVPFAFTGKIQKITLTIDRPKLTPKDELELREASMKAADQK